MRIVLLVIGALYAGIGVATEPEDFLAAYAEQAKQANPGFTGFSAERGRAFYFRTHKIDGGSELSCSSCHHADPRKETIAHQGEFPCRACHITLHKPSGGRAAIKRQIPPLAPSANPDRFTREVNVEAWFDWNCKLLLKRECTPVEKGDLVTWLLTIQ
jgi:ribosomal protein S27E